VIQCTVLKLSWKNDVLVHSYEHLPHLPCMDMVGFRDVMRINSIAIHYICTILSIFPVLTLSSLSNNWSPGIELWLHSVPESVSLFRTISKSVNNRCEEDLRGIRSIRGPSLGEVWSMLR